MARRRRSRAEFLLLLLLAGCQLGTEGGSTSGAVTGGSVIPVATTVGVPQGEVVASTIGATGGSLGAASAKVRITVPPGSVSADTVFTVTPISSRAPGALGTSFRIEAGQPLRGPVKVTFQGLGFYASGLGVTSLGIRFQDARGFWVAPDAVTHDAALNTVTATTSHLSDWTLVLANAPDLEGTFTLTQTVGIPFTATGTAAFYGLPVASEPTYFVTGTITIPPLLTSGNLTCVPDAQTKNLDLSIAEIHAATLRWGLNGLWGLTCTDGTTGAVSSVDLGTMFDTMKINLTSCAGAYVGTQVNGAGFVQGSYRTDCGATGAVAATWDFRGCTAGGACLPANTCLIGIVTCNGGVGSCTPTGIAPGADPSCGTCLPVTCRAGIDCGSIPDGCGGTLACGSTCTAPQTCGGGGTLNVCGGGGGVCVPLTCRAGIDCGSIPDGCGGTLACGNSCVGTQTCGGGGTPGICGGGTAGGLFLNGFFPIGVDAPVTADLAVWASRGMNTIVRGPPGPEPITLQAYESNVGAWNAANPGQAFRRIREPLPGWGAGDPSGYSSADVAASTPAGDVPIPLASLLAWAMPHEPDSGGALAVHMTYLQQYSAKWRAADPARPIYLNLGGDYLLVGSQDYSQAIAYADWISTDVAPFTGPLRDVSRRGDPTVVGQALDAVTTIADRVKFSWIECGNVSAAHYEAGPTGPQVRTMIWNAIIHGARGYVCRIADLDSGLNSSVTVAERAEIAATNAWINSLSTVLQDQIIAPTLTGPADAWGHGVIHVGGRRTTAGTYYIVQNVSNTASFTGSIPLPGVSAATGATIYGQGPGWPATADVTVTTCSGCVVNGSITDTLAPNAVHVIQVR